MSRPAETVDQAIAIVRAHKGPAEDFKLALADCLLDEVGVNMAIIGDVLLDKGFAPDGFAQRDGYRVYAYRDLEAI